MSFDKYHTWLRQRMRAGSGPSQNVSNVLKWRVYGEHRSGEDPYTISTKILIHDVAFGRPPVGWETPGTRTVEICHRFGVRICLGSSARSSGAITQSVVVILLNSIRVLSKAVEGQRAKTKCPSCCLPFLNPTLFNQIS